MIEQFKPLEMADSERRDDDLIQSVAPAATSNAGAAAAAVRVRGDRVTQAKIDAENSIENSAENGAENSIENSAGRDALPGSGAFMPAPVQAKMERAFGVDFSSVRVHEGPDAGERGAHAFTQGEHIHFAPGRYHPTSHEGQELLGHELAHVVQQRAGRVAVPQAKRESGAAPINADPALEAEADLMGARAARGESATMASRGQAMHTSSAQPIQRQMVEKVASSTAIARIALAQRAIEHVNTQVMIYGASNQVEDIALTGGVAHKRGELLRGGKFMGEYHVDKDARETDQGGNSARGTTLAEYYHAGACDDYSHVTFNYLREHASGQLLTRCTASGSHHAFVIIGDLDHDADEDLVVADPWPTRPQACTWRDFWAYTGRDNHDQIKRYSEMASDGKKGTKEHKGEVTFDKKKTKAKNVVESDPRALLRTMATMRQHKDAWDHQHTVHDDVDHGDGVFYYDSSWSPKQKAKKKQQFEESVAASRHMSDKALKRLGLTRASVPFNMDTLFSGFLRHIDKDTTREQVDELITRYLSS